MTDTIADFEGEQLNVELGQRSYPIMIGIDQYKRLPQVIEQVCGKRRVILITDQTVRPLYAELMVELFQKAEMDAALLSIPTGEISKSMTYLEALYDGLFDLNAERSNIIAAVGGGVVGDLAGFTAATFKRGLTYVQVPTTLLAMVDSSVGGKTGINHPRGKNMIGAFYQPKLVFADIISLQTLPRRELSCGLAESVKHGIIQDEAFFDFMEQNADAIVKLDEPLMAKLVLRNCQIKASVVSQDETEEGLRGILNFGHTIGHTLESFLPDKPYHHGEAVSLGMVAAARLAVNRKMLRMQDAFRITSLLEKFGLPTKLEQEPPVNKLFEAMLQDKKVTQGKIKFVLPKGIGSCRFADDLTEKEITGAIASLYKGEQAPPLTPRGDQSPI